MNTQTRRNALDRGLEILSLLASAGPLSFSAIAAHTGAANTVVARLLRPLVTQGWVTHRDDGRYAPGPRLDALRAEPDPLGWAQPVLNSLRDLTACTCLLLGEESGPAGPYIRTLAKAGHEDGLGMQEVGAIRSCYLNHPWSWIFLEHHDPDTRTTTLAAESPPTWLRRAWQAGVAQLHSEGWCQLSHSGCTKLAAAVPGSDGRPRAVLGLGWPGPAPTGSQRQQLRRALLSAAADLARVCRQGLAPDQAATMLRP